MTGRPPHHRRPDTPARSATVMLGATALAAVTGTLVVGAASTYGHLTRAAAGIIVLTAGTVLGWRAAERTADSHTNSRRDATKILTRGTGTKGGT